MDCVVAVLHNETIENFQHFGSLIGSDSGKVFEDRFVTI